MSRLRSHPVHRLITEFPTPPPDIISSTILFPQNFSRLSNLQSIQLLIIESDDDIHHPGVAIGGEVLCRRLVLNDLIYPKQTSILPRLLLQSGDRTKFNAIYNRIRQTIFNNTVIPIPLFVFGGDDKSIILPYISALYERYGNNLNIINFTTSSSFEDYITTQSNTSLKVPSLNQITFVIPFDNNPIDDSLIINNLNIIYVHPREKFGASTTSSSTRSIYPDDETAEHDIIISMPSNPSKCSITSHPSYMKYDKNIDSKVTSSSVSNLRHEHGEVSHVSFERSVDNSTVKYYAIILNVDCIDISEVPCQIEGPRLGLGSIVTKHLGLTIQTINNLMDTLMSSSTTRNEGENGDISNLLISCLLVNFNPKLGRIEEVNCSIGSLMQFIFKALIALSSATIDPTIEPVTSIDTSASSTDIPLDTATAISISTGTKVDPDLYRQYKGVE